MTSLNLKVSNTILILISIDHAQWSWWWSLRIGYMDTREYKTKCFHAWSIESFIVIKLEFYFKIISNILMANNLLLKMIDISFLIGCSVMLTYLKHGVTHQMISNASIPNAQPQPNAMNMPQKNERNL
jgi:hypothetical protein